MNTKDLTYFSSLVELKNYTLVAKKLRVSQPTITVAIQRLESEFETTLIERDRVHNKLSITQAGTLLYQRAQQILKNLDLVKSEIDQIDKPIIRFGLPQLIGSIWFPLVIGDLFDKGLMKYIHTTESNSDILLKQIKNSELDVALLATVRPLQSADLDTVLLASHPFKVAVNKNHPLANRKKITFNQLASEKFIMLDDSFIHRKALDAYSLYADFKPNVIYRSENIDLIKKMVVDGYGVSLLLSDSIDNDRSLVSLQLEEPVAERFNLSLAIRKSFLPNEMQRDFINSLFNLRKIILNNN